MASAIIETVHNALRQLGNKKHSDLENRVQAAQANLFSPPPEDLAGPDALEHLAERRLNESKSARAAQARGEESFQTLLLGSIDLTNGADRIDTALKELGATPEEIEQKLKEELGLTAQAVIETPGKFFIDPETGIVIKGQQVGQLNLPTRQVLEQFKPGEPIDTMGITDRVPETSARSSRRYLKNLRDAQLAAPGNQPDEFTLAQFTILRQESPQTSSAVTLPTETTPTQSEPHPPTAAEKLYTLNHAFGPEGLLRGNPTTALNALLHIGTLQEGLDVVQTRDGHRAITEKGMNIIKQLSPLGSRRITSESVKEFLLPEPPTPEPTPEPELSAPSTPAPAEASEKPRYLFGSKVLKEARLPNTTTHVLDTIAQGGGFAEGLHTITTAGGRTAYTPLAVTVVEGLARVAADEGRKNFTKDFVGRNTFFPTRRYEGPPLNPLQDHDLTEYLVARQMQAHLPAINARRPVNPEFEEELANRVYELKIKLDVGPSAEDVPPDKVRSFASESITAETAKEAGVEVLRSLGDRLAPDTKGLTEARPGYELAYLYAQGLKTHSLGDILYQTEQSIKAPGKGFNVKCLDDWLIDSIDDSSKPS